ncbi:hypothetical protein [Gryllotalpicola protaetiae]|uniref:Uncharacterized protein n=1 Tax=Gryllotalpicola protaetiae TaxID=2419771 RepID=A0A387BHW9_9MICO|nr:hypothetical protein [Gryllotalpicola protaetiae]AYG03423.1 hypothetical protein D7I44_07660 [Gryllotalpicola protaetiae]
MTVCLGGSAASAARQSAHERRTAVLEALRHGRASIGQVLDLACSEQGAPVRRIRLAQLLRATGRSKREVEQVIELVSATLETDVSVWTIGDIVSARRGAKPVIALADALAPREASRHPWG